MKENGEFMKKLVLIDGNSLMFRSYYATAYTGNIMKTKEGLYTNAVFGFCNMITKLLENEQYAFVAFDAGKQTFRHKEYADYKGTRKPLPEELRVQIPLIKDYLDIIGIKRMESLDYEADDLLATASNYLKNDFDEILVVTGDRDLLQLVDDKVTVALTKKGVGELDTYTKNNFHDKVGYNPLQITDYKGIAGDTSDNLPGIRGIGEKTAIKLLNDFNSLEEIYNHLDSLTTRTRNLFIEHRDDAYQCKRLATLENNAKVELKLEDVKIKETDSNKLIEFYTKMEFFSFIKKLKSEISEENAKTEEIVFENEINLQGNGYIAYEIVGNNYVKDEFLGIGVLINGKKYFLSPQDLNKQEVKEYFENEKFLKYVFDYKGLAYLLKKNNIKLKGVIFDLLIASYLINPSYANDDFKIVSEKYENNNMPYYDALFGSNTKLHKPEEEAYKNYIISKCVVLERIKDKVLSSIIDNELEYLMMVEMNLSVVLSEMEYNGVKLDLEHLDKIGEDLKVKLLEAEERVFELAGERFNINSPKQLGEVLFEKLNIPYLKGKKKGRNGYSTNAEVLEKLSKDYEIAQRILEYRGIAKLINTYVNGLKEVCYGDYIHPVYKQALTNTGRLSSIEPNIQNMPIRTELGQVIREVFVSRYQDGVILSADYSQIELRLLAHISKDEKMIGAFNSHIDFHTKTASEIYDIPIENVTKEIRRTAKAINFGIIYGMSAWGLSENLNITPMEANIFINKYFYNYPNAKKCLDEFIKNAYEKGYSETLYGRRRYINELQNPNAALRQFGERTAMNSPIQGTAADIIKIAMNKVSLEMKKQNLKSIMIAQVHDELVFDCPKEEVDTMKELVKNAMESAVKLSVPLEVSIACGKNWFEAK